MSSLFKVLTALLVTQLILAEDLAPKCGPGCLVCSTDNKECLACLNTSIVNGECKDEGDCFFSVNILGTIQCMVCKNDKAPDSKGVCVNVSSKTTDCIYYAEDSKCNGCKSDKLLIIETLKCEALSTKIDKCVLYGKEGANLQCGACEENYMTSVDGKSCVEASGDGCDSAECSSCKFGFYADYYDTDTSKMHCVKSKEITAASNEITSASNESTSASNESTSASKEITAAGIFLLLSVTLMSSF